MSKNFNHPVKYRRFINNPLTMDEINNIYYHSKVQGVKVDLYHDFVMSLSDQVIESYLGDKHHKQIIHKLEHFDWCWKKTITMYTDMGYTIKNQETLFDYFGSFFMDVFYFDTSKDEELNKSIRDVWDYIFNYDVVKSKWDVNNFLDVYNMFENEK